MRISEMNTKKVQGLPGLAASIAALTLAALPAFGLTPPALQVAVSGGSVTIDSTGAQTYTGSCNAVTCPGTATVAAGSVTWSGSIGAFTISTLNGRTKPALTAPNIDVGVASIQTGAGQ
jgi:hypothetical protein